MLTTIAWCQRWIQGSLWAIFTRSGIDYKAIIGDGGAMVCQPRVYGCYTCSWPDSDRCCFRQISGFLDEIPAEVQEEIKQNCSNGWSLEDTIACSSESTYAGWTGNGYQRIQSQVNQNCSRRRSKRVENTRCQIDWWSSCILECSKKLRDDFGFTLQREPVVALLVGNDQLNEVKLKNHLGADFFWTCKLKWKWKNY